MQVDGTTVPEERASSSLPRPKSPLGYTPAEVAEILGKHRNTIYAWINADDPVLTSRKINGEHYIPVREVHELLDPELMGLGRAS
jgi:hypothetical protein